MTKRLKVILFLRRIGPYHHARFQANEELDLVVVETRSGSQEYPWQFEPVNKHYINERFQIPGDPEAGLRDERLKNEISRLIQFHHPDVIVTTGWADHEYHAVILEASKRKIPRVVISDSRYEDEPRMFLKEQVKKIILRGYSSALVAGTSSRNYMIGLGFPATNIFKPWDVIDNQYFAPFREESQIGFNSRNFICVSRFIEKKNIEGLLDAFARYRDQGGKRKLVLLGSGEREPELRTRINALFLNDAVEIKGFVQYEHLPAYLTQALCLILPSFSDQWGLVVNEALASGLPVIVSSNCGCVIDLVENQGNGDIFDPTNMSQLTDAIIKMDAVTEIAWSEMSKNSSRSIATWDLSDFARGLTSTCQAAFKLGNKRIMRMIHVILRK